MDERIDIPVTGMTCAACAQRVERVLRGAPGVAAVSVNIATNIATIHFDPQRAGPDTLADAIRGAGYDICTSDDDVGGAHEPGEHDAAGHLTLVWLLAGPLLVLGMSHGSLLPRAVDVPIQAALSAALVTWGAAPLWRPALAALRAWDADMNVLVVLGATTAWGLSFATWTGLVASDAHATWFESAGVIVAVTLLGRWLEARARAGLGDTLRAWRSALPEQVLTTVDGVTVVQRPLHEVRVGDRVVVTVGDTVPVDGVVRDGAADVDEAMLTGEGAPVPRGPGDVVHAGTRAVTGRLIVAAQATGADTAVSRIAAAVLQAQSTRPQLAQLADRAVRWFVPAVLLAAVLAAITAAWWASPGEAARDALLTATTVLVVACPCALGLATPTAVLAGTTRAARAGVLVRDGAAMERAAAVDVAVVDKTGTLVEADLDARLTWSAGELAEVRAWAAGAPGRHPIAQSIARWAGAGAPWDRAEELPGAGVRGTDHKGHTLRLGSRAWLTSVGVTILAPDQPEVSEALLAVDDAVVAVFQLEAHIADTARALIIGLTERGLTVHLATGDRPARAQQLADELGITEVHAAQSPEDKRALVETLQRAGHRVFMIGDGVNDATALSIADVGVSVQRGASLATASAHFVLLRDDLRCALAAIDTSRATVRTIRRNLTWATVYNLLLIPLAAGWLGGLTSLRLDPMWASAAMAASSISVVLSSLALARSPTRLPLLASPEHR